MAPEREMFTLGSSADKASGLRLKENKSLSSAGTPSGGLGQRLTRAPSSESLQIGSKRLSSGEAALLRPFSELRSGC